MERPPSSLKLQHVGLRGGRLKEVMEFFGDVLGFTHTETAGTDVTGLPFGLCFFRGDVLHHDIGVEVWAEGRSHEDEERKNVIRFPHVAFEVPDKETLMAWHRRLKACEGVEIVQPYKENGDPVVFSPTHPEGNGDPGENRAIFIRDPFGNRIEFFCDMALMTEKNEIDQEWNRNRLKKDGYPAP